MKAQTPEFLIILGTVFLIGAIFVVLSERFLRRPVQDIWLMYRIQILVSAWILVPAWLGGWWLRGSLLVTAGVTSWELFNVIDRMGLRPYRWTGVMASLLCCVAAWWPETPVFLYIPAFLALGMLVLPVFGRPLTGALPAAAATLLGTIWPGSCLAFLTRLPLLGNGFGDLVFLYAILELNDVFAFLWGKYFGRTPLAPRLSPKKTREGSAGGLATAMVAGAVLAPLLLGLSAFQGAGIGLALGTFGQIADLTASAVKREAQVKDFSNLVPTQGGVLDLYDSLTLVAPFWYLFLYWFRGRGTL